MQPAQMQKIKSSNKPIPCTEVSRVRCAFYCLGGVRASTVRPIALQRAPRARAIAEPQAAEKVSPELSEKCIRTLQFLAVDATNHAGSGHPGAPMALAPLGYLLFNEYMRFNPKNPALFNRDRFVLSNGHAAMLQYGLLHLCGFQNFTMEQLKSLRSLGSITPGHPEREIADGIEVTTGPLGQGFANSVGLAVAEAHLAARFNKPDAPKMFDNYTYCILGDGCMMEGISQEAASLAGHWGLGKLIAFYDDNKISIDGSTEMAFTEDTLKRFEGLGWHVLDVADGTDVDGIRHAIEAGQAEGVRPTLVRLSTTIGYGSPKLAGTAKVHGSPLGEEEGDATREALGWPYGRFEVPDDVYHAMRDNKVEQGRQLEEARAKAMEEYRAKYADEADEIELIEAGGLPEGWEKILDMEFEVGAGDATRKHSSKILNKLAPVLPTLIGGSADLASSNKTYVEGVGDFQKDNYIGRNIHFGVREHGMSGISNGIAAYAPGLVPFASTFTIFTDYARGAIRLSALSRNRVLYVTTHDSIGLGGDGPTHQPIEQLAGFRAMPNMHVVRPAGGKETVGAYHVALSRAHGPTLLALSRQPMPELPGTSAEGVLKGGYVVDDSDGPPSHILIGTGSEVPLCVEAARILRGEGLNPRVVSLPCWEIWEEQALEYRESVLPKACRKRLSVEAQSTLGWREFVTDDGAMFGMHCFGASAPGGDAMKEFGFTPERVADAARAL